MTTGCFYKPWIRWKGFESWPVAHMCPSSVIQMDWVSSSRGSQIWTLVHPFLVSFKYFVMTCHFSLEHQNFKSWKLLQGHSKWSFVRSQDHRVGRAFAAEISFVTTLVPLCRASDCGVWEPRPPTNRWLVVVERCCSKITPTGLEIVISQIHFKSEDWNLNIFEFTVDLEFFFQFECLNPNLNLTP